MRWLASGSRAGVDVRGPGGSEGERERPTRSWAVREAERAQLGSGRAGWAGREKGEREWAAGSVGLDWAWGLGLLLG